MKLQIPLNWRIVKYGFDHYNFVIGGGHYISAHLGGGVTLGYMVYIDDDYNIDLMISSSKDLMSDREYSGGVKYEISFDANTSSEMAGISYGVDGSKSLKLKGFSAGTGISQSADGFVKSYSGNLSYGVGKHDKSGSLVKSENQILIHFNPVEFIKNSLKIVTKSIKSKL